MRNLGPKSRSWLNEAGIKNIEDLKRLGPVPAFLAVRHLGHAVSFNFLWALAAAIEDRDWRDLSAQEKTLLKNQLDNFGK